MTNDHTGDKRSDDLGTLSGSYALNGLDPADVAAFEQHLASSQETRNEVTELTDTAVLLGLAATPVTPSAGLKASIMSQLDAHPQVSPAATAPAPAPVAAAIGSAAKRAERRWFARPVTALAAAAAVIALVAGGGMIASTIAGTQQQQQQADQLAAINAADDVQRASVELDGGGTATLVWSNELLSSALIVDGMQALPDGKVYELWYIGDDGARPAGTFTTGGERTWRVLDGDMAAGDKVGVTIEPAGGSEIPTTDPVVVIASA